MNRKRLLAGVALLLVGMGCTKRPGPPSAEFGKARDQFLQLESDEPTTVFTDPKVKVLLAVIEAVPADSISKSAADSLAQEIREGLADAEKTKIDRAASVASSNKPAAYVAIQLPVPPTPAVAPVAPVAARTDAGPPPPPAFPTAGMSFAEFSQRFGGCFAKTSVFGQPDGTSGDVFTLNADKSCQDKFSSFASTLVLVSGAKVSGLVPKSAVISQHEVTINTPSAKPPPAAEAPPAPSPAPTPTLVRVPVPPPVDPNFNPDAVNH